MMALVAAVSKNMSDFPNKCGEQHQQERLDTWRGLSELRAMGKVRASNPQQLT